MQCLTDPDLSEKIEIIDLENEVSLILLFPSLPKVPLTLKISSLQENLSSNEYSFLVEVQEYSKRTLSIDCSSMTIDAHSLQKAHYHSTVIGTSYIDLSSWPRTPSACGVTFTATGIPSGLSLCSF